MSTAPEPDLDLEKLFLPAWAQDPPQVNRYADFAGDDRGERRHDDRPGRRPPRRDQPGGPRPRASRSEGGERRSHRPEARQADRPAPRPEPLPPLPVTLSVLPDEKGVESLARQIRVTGRAYPLFDIAHLILQKPERHHIRFDVKKGPEGKPLQPLFLCALDDSLWLSEDEAVQHILSRHFGTFYQAERTATEPPKGTYTFVAQCGLSGKILGPPNYHDYQTQLHKLHSDRFARMPFEAFKARVRIVKDEAVVKQWIEERSFKTEYSCLNVPEPRKLGSREEVNQHFREVHLANIVKSVDTFTASGTAARQLRSPGIQRAVRAAWEDQRRFPLQVATVLSQQFAGHGLQFFKVNRTVTHVSVARPRFLDMEATPVSEGVKRIVEFINTHSKCTRRKLLEALAPTPVPSTTPVPEPPLTPPSAPPEQTALASDLHWLIHEGHVIEFANGTLETARKPVVKPPRPEKAPAPGSAPTSPTPPPSTLSDTPAATPVEHPSAPPAEPVAAQSSEPLTDPRSTPTPEPAG
jgi:hypothetical protein